MRSSHFHVSSTSAQYNSVSFTAVRKTGIVKSGSNNPHSAWSIARRVFSEQLLTELKTGNLCLNGIAWWDECHVESDNHGPEADDPDAHAETQVNAQAQVPEMLAPVEDQGMSAAEEEETEPPGQKRKQKRRSEKVTL